CWQNLHDPELSPQRAADHLRISVRTLHSRFKQIGQTFGHWVLEKRLEACHEALCDQNQRAFNISQIAYRWGLNDLSHFNKAFRARFKQSPRSWRNRFRDIRQAAKAVLKRLRRDGAWPGNHQLDLTLT